MAAQLDKTTANILTSESFGSSTAETESRDSVEEFVKDESENSIEGEGEGEKNGAERARARVIVGEERKER